MTSLKIPSVQLVLGLLIVGVPCFSLLIFGQTFIQALGLLKWQSQMFKVALSTLSIMLSFVLYRWFVSRIEKRTFTDFAIDGIANKALIAFLYTLLACLTVFLFLFLNGNLAMFPGKGWTLLPLLFFNSLRAAVIEEIVFRGILFRLLEKQVGSYLAIAVSSLLFGAIHYINPGATVFSALAVGVQSGLLLCGVYMLTRNLWPCIAVHFTWNMATSVMGFYSFTEKPRLSVFSTKLSGSELLTGGQLGIEFSLLVVLTGFLLGTRLIYKAYKRQKILSLV